VKFTLVKPFLLYTFLSVLILQISQVNACDVCGGASMSQSLGVLPGFQKHVVGIRYGQGSFLSNHPLLKAPSTETYQHVELRLRAVYGSNWQFYAQVPYRILTKQEELTTRNQGLADVSLSAAYILLNTENERNRHFLMMGTGVKLPTGNAQFIDPQAQIWIPNMQLGTGAYDALFFGSYIAQFTNHGLLVESATRLSGKDKSQYRFGNYAAVSARYFYKYKFRGTEALLLPAFGGGIEYTGRDTRFGLFNNLSGGYVSQVSAGLDYFNANWNVNAQFVLPVTHALSDGYVTPKPSFMVQLAYLF
jgi:hypothetical protein